MRIKKPNFKKLLFVSKSLGLRFLNNQNLSALSKCNWFCFQEQEPCYLWWISDIQSTFEKFIIHFGAGWHWSPSKAYGHCRDSLNRMPLFSSSFLLSALIYYMWERDCGQS